MKNITENVKKYVSAWNATVPETVKAALQQCCAPEITYTDHQTPILNGIDALVSLIMSAHEKFPGITFSVLTTPEYFDHNCYYSWGVNFPGAAKRQDATI